VRAASDGRGAVGLQQADAETSLAQEAGDVHRVAPDVGFVVRHVRDAQQLNEAVDDFLFVSLTPDPDFLGHPLRGLDSAVAQGR
jgi:hypothetical protein